MTYAIQSKSLYKQYKPIFHTFYLQFGVLTHVKQVLAVISAINFTSDWPLIINVTADWPPIINSAADLSLTLRLFL